MKEYQDYEIGDLDIKIGENKLKAENRDMGFVSSGNFFIDSGDYKLVVKK